MRRAGPMRGGSGGGGRQGKFEKVRCAPESGGMLLREQKVASDGHSEDKADAAQVIFSPRIAFLNVEKTKPKTNPTKRTEVWIFAYFLMPLWSDSRFRRISVWVYRCRMFSPRLSAFYFFERLLFNLKETASVI